MSAVALCCLLALTVQDVSPLRLGARAPELGSSGWVEARDPSRAREVRSTGSPPGGFGDGLERARAAAADGGDPLAALQGQVVVLHTLAWDGAGPGQAELLALLGRLAAANADRPPRLVALAPALADEAARERLRALGLEHPVALFGPEDESPYLPGEAAAPPAAFVLGPNRALLFAGDPLADGRGFEAALEEAWLRPVAPPVERALDARLDEAFGSYAAGRLDEAARAAERLGARAEQGGDAGLAEGAAELARLCAVAQAEWLAELRRALSEQDAYTFARRARDVERAFARGEARRALAALQKEARRETSLASRLRDNEAWFAALPDRPALFPEQRSRRGDRYAKALEKLERASGNSLFVTRTAAELCARYARRDG